MNDLELIRRDQVLEHIDELWRRGEFTPETVAMTINALPEVEAIPLRCRIGEAVWVIMSKCHAAGTKCPGVQKCPCGFDREFKIYPMRITRDMFMEIHKLTHLHHFRWGETVFKTKKEAEAKLAERIEDNENHQEKHEETD